MKLFGHRGARDLVPENTLPSFELAWKCDVDGIEFDIQLTKDEKVVVIHDTSTKRTAGVDLLVKDATVEQLRKLDFGSFKDVRYKDVRIPLLDEVVYATPKNMMLEIEIKDDGRVIPFLKKILDQYKVDYSRVIVSSNKYDVARALRSTFPDTPVQWIQMSKLDPVTNKRAPYKPELIEMVKTANLTGLSLNIAGLEDSYIQQVRSAGLRYHIWQVSSPEIYKKYSALGAFGGSTDNPVAINHSLD